jgi:hypothetical protein
MPHNADNNPLLEGDSETRIDAALATAGTLAPVEAHIEDWGHFDGDHSDATHDYYNGVAENRDADGMGYATPEEIERQYDSMVSEDLDIL